MGGGGAAVRWCGGGAVVRWCGGGAVVRWWRLANVRVVCWSECNGAVQVASRCVTGVAYKGVDQGSRTLAFIRLHGSDSDVAGHFSVLRMG